MSLTRREFLRRGALASLGFVLPTIFGEKKVDSETFIPRHSLYAPYVPHNVQETSESPDVILGLEFQDLSSYHQFLDRDDGGVFPELIGDRWRQYSRRSITALRHERLTYPSGNTEFILAATLIDKMRQEGVNPTRWVLAHPQVFNQMINSARWGALNPGIIPPEMTVARLVALPSEAMPQSWTFFNSYTRDSQVYVEDGISRLPPFVIDGRYAVNDNPDWSTIFRPGQSYYGLPWSGWSRSHEVAPNNLMVIDFGGIHELLHVLIPILGDLYWHSTSEIGEPVAPYLEKITAFPSDNMSYHYATRLSPVSSIPAEFILAQGWRSLQAEGNIPESPYVQFPEKLKVSFVDQERRDLLVKETYGLGDYNHPTKADNPPHEDGFYSFTPDLFPGSDGWKFWHIAVKLETPSLVEFVLPLPRVFFLNIGKLLAGNSPVFTVEIRRPPQTSAITIECLDEEEFESLSQTKFEEIFAQTKINTHIGSIYLIYLDDSPTTLDSTQLTQQRPTSKQDVEMRIQSWGH